jgi:predicted deacylase
MRPIFFSVRPLSRMLGSLALAALLCGTSYAQTAGAKSGGAKTTATGAQSAKGPTAKKPTPKSTASSGGASRKPAKKSPARRPPAKKGPPEIPATVPENVVSADSFTVGTATAARGSRAFGELRIAAGSDSAISIGLAVVHGAKPGPVIAFVSGAHGTEYTSVVALTKLIKLIDPMQLTGTVIIVPLLNVSSFERMVPHVNPVDGKGMNTLYPGNASGTQSERVLAAVAEQVVKRADVIVDLHGGDLDEDLRPYSYWIRTGDAAQDRATRALAVAFGLDLIIVRDIDTANPAQIRNLSGYALSLGKQAIVAEAGRAGIVTASETNTLIAGGLNILGTLHLIPREVGTDGKVNWVGADQRVRADSGGMFSATVERGAKVRKGQKVGTITDYVGRTVADVLAPQEGVVTFIRSVPSMSKGATLVTVAMSYGATPPAYSKPKP